jgi:hypothetical protein
MTTRVLVSLLLFCVLSLAQDAQAETAVVNISGGVNIVKEPDAKYREIVPLSSSDNEKAEVSDENNIAFTDAHGPAPQGYFDSSGDDDAAPSK